MGIPAVDLHFGALPPNPHEIQYDTVALDRLRRVADWIPPTTVAAGIRKTWKAWNPAC
jgi:hypothetical protein